MPTNKEPESNDDAVNYAEAMAELEQIVSQLEADDPKIDELADQVERAAELITACRDRLGTTRERIDEITGNVEESG